MSQTTYRISTTVLPGSKIEITVPGLKEGTEVEVTIVPRPHKSMLELLGSLPPGPRSASTSEEFERNFQQERDSWDR